MKKLILAALVVFSLSSCEDEVRTNIPSFVTNIGYDYWRAEDMQAQVDGNKLIITAGDLTERFTVTIPNYDLGRTYDLGPGNQATVEYVKIIDGVEEVYSSRNGSGYVQLYSADYGEPNTVTGRFLAEVKSSTGQTVTLNKGVFYKVPLFQILN